MKQIDIYVGTNGEEATSHGAEYVFSGYNAADALTRFVADEDAMDELRHDHPDFEQLTAFDDETSASLFPLEDGSWELHVDSTYAVEITIPPTEFVSVTDAADMLGITRQRVQMLVVNGKLNGRMVGSTWMVTRASVEKRMDDSAGWRKVYEVQEQWDYPSANVETARFDTMEEARKYYDGVDVKSIWQRERKSSSVGYPNDYVKRIVVCWYVNDEYERDIKTMAEDVYGIDMES